METEQLTSLTRAVSCGAVVPTSRAKTCPV